MAFLLNCSFMSLFDPENNLSQCWALTLTLPYIETQKLDDGSFLSRVSIRFCLGGKSFGVGGEWKKLTAKAQVCGKRLQSGPLRMHFQHSRAFKKLKCLNRTQITILFLNRGNFQRKVGGQFMWNCREFRWPSALIQNPVIPHCFLI